MISFAKLLTKKPENVMTHVKFLLSGISNTAIETDAGARPLFQEKIGQITALLTDSLAEEAVSSELASVVNLLADYNRGAEHKAQAQQRELRGIISAATDTIASIGASSQTGVEQLRALESSLDSASKVEDLRLLRHKLFACLTVLRNETTRVQMDSQMLIRSLTASVLRASSELAPGTDATTGLPGPAALQKDLSIAAEVGESTALAIFVLASLARSTLALAVREETNCCAWQPTTSAKPSPNSPPSIGEMARP